MSVDPEATQRRDTVLKVVTDCDEREFVVVSQVLAESLKRSQKPESAIVEVARSDKALLRFVHTALGTESGLQWNVIEYDIVDLRKSAAAHSQFVVDSAENRERLSQILAERKILHLVAVTIQVNCSIAAWIRQSPKSRQLRAGIRTALLSAKSRLQKMDRKEKEEPKSQMGECQFEQLAVRCSGKLHGLNLATERCLFATVELVYAQLVKTLASVCDNNASLTVELLCNLLSDDTSSAGCNALSDTVYCVLQQSDELLAAIKAQIAEDFLQQTTDVMRSAEGRVLVTQLADSSRLSARNVVFLHIVEHYVATLLTQSKADSDTVVSGESLALILENAELRLAIGFLFVFAVRQLYPSHVFELLFVRHYCGRAMPSLVPPSSSSSASGHWPEAGGPLPVECSETPPKDAILECMCEALPTIADAIQRLVAYARQCQAIDRSVHGDCEFNSKLPTFGVPHDNDCSAERISAHSGWLLDPLFPELMLQSDDCCPTRKLLLRFVLEQLNVDDTGVVRVTDSDLVETEAQSSEDSDEKHSGAELLTKTRKDLKKKQGASDWLSIERMARIVLHVAAVHNTVLIRLRLDAGVSIVSRSRLWQQLSVRKHEVDLSAIRALRRPLAFIKRKFDAETAAEIRAAIGLYTHNGGFRNGRLVATLRRLGFRSGEMPCLREAHGFCPFGIWCIYRHADDVFSDGAIADGCAAMGGFDGAAMAAALPSMAMASAATLPPSTPLRAAPSALRGIGAAAMPPMSSLPPTVYPQFGSQWPCAPPPMSVPMEALPPSDMHSRSTMHPDYDSHAHCEKMQQKLLQIIETETHKRDAASASD